MERQYSIADAKNKLPSIIHAVEKGPLVKLTRRGKTVAILLSIEEYERLSRKKGSFWCALTSFRKIAQNENIEINNADFKGLRDHSPGREVDCSE